MIGRISGSLLEISPPQAVVDACGVGYEIDLPIVDCTSLPEIGSPVALFTHLVVREDAHALYGFLTAAKRDCFRQLIKVSGIGPRIALALLSTLTLPELDVALTQGDVATLCRTPGIGKKMAERMLLELKDKLRLERSFAPEGREKPTVAHNLRSDISNALISLGFNEKEIAVALKDLSSEISDLGAGIKQALQFLNKHK